MNMDFNIGDLVITDDHYYGIVTDLRADTVNVFCSHGLHMAYSPQGVRWIGTKTGYSDDPAHANFIELVSAWKRLQP